MDKIIKVFVLMYVHTVFMYLFLTIYFLAPRYLAVFRSGAKKAVVKDKL
jgi:hypothetical protein